jgi:putative endopeptidase
MKPSLALVLCGLHCGLAFAAPPAFDRTGFDPTVRVQDDLFRAANGQWLKDTPIPADKSGYGIAYELADRADERLRKISEDLGASNAAPGSVEQKIGAYYRSFMDEAAIERAGLAPLAPWRAEIDALNDKQGLAALWGRWQGVVSTPIGVQVNGDPKEPTVNRVSTWQDGLGLPDRDYYLKKDAHFAKARTAYLAYLETLFTLLGDTRPAASAQTVYALEKKLAAVQWSQVESRDAIKTYNPKTVPALAAYAPGVDWKAYFEAARVAGIDRLSVSQPSYSRGLGRIVQATPLATWKLYLQARLVDSQAEVLPKAVRDANFAYRGQALRGLEQPLPRWKKATAALDVALGEAVGQIYVARHFPPDHKARMQQLVANLMATYAESIDGLAWMSPQTKARAKEKLAKYTVKIGYPDKWRDYTPLQIVDGDALGNDTRAGRFEYERRAVQVGRPVDRSEWFMTPQTVNAYYDPSTNEIVFPAAILDAPYFDMAADDAANYGATGATIGHEISHGFDDFGSQYDGNGKLQNWWTPADRKAFDKLGKRLAKQFDAYEPVPGHRVNGKLTLGENIADLSGLEIAFKAYRATLKGQPDTVVDGLTGDQRFFLSYSISWREKVRDARVLQLLTTDPHAPAAFRTNGAAINLDSFHDSFGTKPGDGMYKPRADRIHIW